MLADKEIRGALLEHLRGLPTAPRAILEEVRVHNGNAIADVVAVHSFVHCYEIKGETDAVSRIAKQGSYYDLAFEKITLVTTSNHLKQAYRVAPPHWGIMVASASGHDRPKLRYVRGALNHSSFDKCAALLTLWHKELLSMCGDVNGTKLSRQSLSKLIADKMPARDVGLLIGKLLAERQARDGWSTAI